GHAREGLAREAPSRLRSDRALVRVELGGYRCVVGGVDDHGDVAIILRRRTHQRWSADVDIFDRLVEAHARLRDSFLEWVEVHDHQIDRLNPMLLHLLPMALVGAPREDAAVNLWMESLHAAVEHLGRAGEVLDRSDFDAGRFQSRHRAAGRYDLDTVPRERFGKIRDARLVGDSDQRALYHYLVVAHRHLAPNHARHPFTDCAKHLV